MSEKHLTELPWKALAKQQKITKDLGLGKALAEYGSAPEADRAARLTALEEIKTVARKLKKEQEDKKEVAEYLDEVLGQVEKTRKTVEALKESAGKKEDKKEEETKEDEGEEDAETEEYKKDLKGKLVSALNHVKSLAPGELKPGEEAKPQMKFMALVAGKACAVLVGRKVGSSAKKLLLTIAGVAGGGQVHAGECIFEKNVHTFVLDQVPAGLARKLSKALLAETGQNYKVRVRGRDGSVALDSETDTDPDEAGAGEPPLDSLAAKYQQRLAALEPGLQRALKEQLGETGKMRAVADFAREKAAAGNYDSALKALDALEKLLAAAGVPASGTATTERRDDMASFTERLKALVPQIKAKPQVKAFPGTPGEKGLNVVASEAAVLAKKSDFAKAHELLDLVESLLGTATGSQSKPPGTGATVGISIVKLGTARLEWDNIRSKALGEIQRLKEILQAEYQDDEEEQSTLSGAQQRLDSIIGSMNEELGAKLDEVLKAQPAERPKLAPAAKTVLKRFTDFIGSDEILSVIDGNEYAPDMQVAAPLRAGLQDIAAALG